MTFAVLYSLNTVPSVDSSIPVTIQPVVTHNMLTITVFLNVRKYILSYYSVFITFAHSPRNDNITLLSVFGSETISFTRDSSR